MAFMRTRGGVYGLVFVVALAPIALDVLLSEPNAAIIKATQAHLGLGGTLGYLAIYAAFLWAMFFALAKCLFTWLDRFGQHQRPDPLYPSSPQTQSKAAEHAD